MTPVLRGDLTSVVNATGITDFFDNFEDLLVMQLEAALSIIAHGDDADQHEEWIKNTCAALRDAGSVHPILARYK